MNTNDWQQLTRFEQTRRELTASLNRRQHLSFASPEEEGDRGRGLHYRRCTNASIFQTRINSEKLFLGERSLDTSKASLRLVSLLIDGLVSSLSRIHRGIEVILSTCNSLDWLINYKMTLWYCISIKRTEKSSLFQRSSVHNFAKLWGNFIKIKSN